MPDLQPVVDGDDSFVLGMDGYTSPNKLNPGEYVSGMNIITRGGMARTRPGSASAPFELPSGRLQGITFFTPASGVGQLVFAIDGLVYVSESPFKTYYRLNAIQFSPFSKAVAWASCVKSSTHDGEDITWLDRPYPVLVMQDDNSRAAYWDGSIAAHLNPLENQTPIGLWMVWSNNRLWVSRGDQLFASDIGDPLSFTESQYLNEGRSFYLTGNCTGLAETPDQQGILAFTAVNGAFLQSSLTDRTQWLSTPGFMRMMLPHVGCVAPRSIVHQYGLLWWYANSGLISLDSALNLNITSRLPVQDNEMIQAKYSLNPDLSGVCGGRFDNFIFYGVPWGDVKNTRVFVMDQAAFEAQLNSWPSFWTGWSPVEFARGVIGSRERVFTLSADADGQNRIWELFRDERTDDGCPITCYLQTRNHFFQNRDYKRFKYAEVEWVGLDGNVAVMVAVAGIKGGYQPALNADIVATHGQIYADTQYGSLYGSRPQTRITKTVDFPSPSDCNNNCVESPNEGLIDKAFSLLLAWSGDAAVSAYRIFAQSWPLAYTGGCVEDEASEHLLTPYGCGAEGPISDAEAFPRYYATAIVTKTNPDTNATYTVSATRSSQLSQKDANRKATAVATYQVQQQLGQLT